MPAPEDVDWRVWRTAEVDGVTVTAVEVDTTGITHEQRCAIARMSLEQSASLYTHAREAAERGEEHTVSPSDAADWLWRAALQFSHAMIEFVESGEAHLATSESTRLADEFAAEVAVRTAVPPTPVGTPSAA